MESNAEFSHAKVRDRSLSSSRESSYSVQATRAIPLSETRTRDVSAHFHLSSAERGAHIEDALPFNSGERPNIHVTTVDKSGAKMAREHEKNDTNQVFQRKARTETLLLEDTMEYSDVEDFEDYRRGGYHPIHIGDQLKDGRFIILRKLGWGHFSTVWLCWDQETLGLVALKIQKSARHYTEAALDEIALLTTIRDQDPSCETPVVCLLDHFQHAGPNGAHTCMVFEVLGRSLLSLIRHHGYRGAPISMVKCIVKQVIEALDFCHRNCGIIHTDIKPENCLFVPPREAMLELAAVATMEALTAVEQRCGASRSSQDSPGAPSEVTVSERAHTHEAKEILGMVSTLSIDQKADACVTRISERNSGDPHPKMSVMPRLGTESTPLKMHGSEQYSSVGARTGHSPEISSKRNPSERAEYSRQSAPSTDWQRSCLALRLAHKFAETALAREREQCTETLAMKRATASCKISASSSSMSEQSQLLRTQNDANSLSESHVGTVSRLAYLRDRDSALKDAAPGLACADGAAAMNRSSEVSWPSPNPHDRGNRLAAGVAADAKQPKDPTGRKSASVHSTRAFNQVPTRPVAWDGWENSRRVKLVDFGNACWIDKHFTEDIQTRQYRSPEVIIGAGYDSSADIWSCACMLFELLTGDFLFDPHSGRHFSRDEDHLALMIELLGPFPKSLLDRGKYTREFFTPTGTLKNIKKLHFWGLADVLRDKYKFPRAVAEEIASFMEPMLVLDPTQRATAAECLRHPWLRDAPEPVPGTSSPSARKTSVRVVNSSAQARAASPPGVGGESDTLMTASRTAENGSFSEPHERSTDDPRMTRSVSPGGELLTPTCERRTPDSLWQRDTAWQHSNHAPPQTLPGGHLPQNSQQHKGCL